MDELAIGLAPIAFVKALSSVIGLISFSLVFYGCSTSPSYSVATPGTPSISVGAGATTTIGNPTVQTGNRNVGTGIGIGIPNTTSIGTDIATQIILGPGLPQIPNSVEQPTQPVSNTRIIRDTPSNVVHRDRETLKGTVVDSHKYSIDSDRKKRNREELDYEGDTGILEDSSSIWDTTTDREIQGVLVKLDDGTEINAINAIYSDLDAGDRVLVRVYVYHSSRLDRNKYRIIRKLDFDQFSSVIH